MSKDKNINPFNAEDIERYQQGRMSASERNALEKAALNDPFLADALEGFMTTTVDLNADITDLKNRLENRLEEKTKLITIAPDKSNWHYLRIAAILLLMAGAGWFFYQYSLNNKNVAPLASNDQKVNADSTSQVTAPSATTENKSGLFSNDTTIIKAGKSKTPANSYYWEHDRAEKKDKVSIPVNSQLDSIKTSEITRDKSKMDDAKEKSLAAEKKEYVANGTGNGNVKDTVIITGNGIRRSAAPAARGKIDAENFSSAPVIGWTAYQQYLKDSLRLPSTYTKKSKAQFVELSFDVDASGKPYNYNIISSFGKSASEEAWRLVSQGPLWDPGKASLKISF